MDFREFRAVLFRRLPIFFLIVVAVISSTVVYTSNQPSEYEASATVAFLPDAQHPSTAVVYSQLVLSLLPTYIQLAESRSFLDGVAQQLPFTSNGPQLHRHVFASPVNSAGALRLVARSRVPLQAQETAAAVASAFLEALKDNGVFIVQVIDRPRLPTSPVTPRPVLVESAAAILALLLGVAGALSWERVFGRVRTARDLSEAAGLPVLGTGPLKSSLQSAPRIVAGDVARAPLQESIRSLATNLLFAARERGIKSVAVTSPKSGDGRSVLAANMAVIFAEMGLNVLIIDADIRHPTLHKFFQQENDRGLTSTVLSGAPRESLVMPTAYNGLRFLRAGAPVQKRSEELEVWLRQMRLFFGNADIVLIDTPPLSATQDVRLLVAAADAALLTVRAGSLSTSQVKKVVESLQLVGALLVGTALTMTTDAGSSDSVQTHYYRGADIAP